MLSETARLFSHMGHHAESFLVIQNDGMSESTIIKVFNIQSKESLQLFGVTRTALYLFLCTTQPIPKVFANFWAVIYMSVFFQRWREVTM